MTSLRGRPAVHRSARGRRLVVALTAGALVLTPITADAQQPPGQDGIASGRHRAQLALDIDVLRAEHVAVSQALADVRDNVAEQQAQLDSAQAALRVAEAEVAAADAAVVEATERIRRINAMADSIVVEAFVNPPVESALEALSAESFSDSTVKQAILDRRATSDAEVLGQLGEAQEVLEAEIARREKAKAEAEARSADAEAALADVESALSQQAAFVLAVQQRLDRTLVEAESIRELDPEMAKLLEEREAELAAALRELDPEVLAQRAQERAAQLSSEAEGNKYTGAVIKPVPGGVVTIACPTGGSISLAGAISGSVERLLADAADDGVTMCGKSYRDPQDQIAMRRQNCGSSEYAIWQMPSSSCSPATARPGTSLHEQGLAIDFTCGGGGTVSWGDSCHDWLRANAANYGLYNLPSEPWHWSVDGN
ncbi:MAG TPA: D-alanyl-D-alanine carboxypeptidase family protein [Acidimicrobiales bacterium]